jgi:hypothetical protein
MSMLSTMSMSLLSTLSTMRIRKGC